MLSWELTLPTEIRESKVFTTWKRYQLSVKYDRDMTNTAPSCQNHLQPQSPMMHKLGKL